MPHVRTPWLVISPPLTYQATNHHHYKHHPTPSQPQPQPHSPLPTLVVTVANEAEVDAGVDDQVDTVFTTNASTLGVEVRVTGGDTNNTSGALQLHEAIM